MGSREHHHTSCNGAAPAATAPSGWSSGSGASTTARPLKGLLAGRSRGSSTCLRSAHGARAALSTTEDTPSPHQAVSRPWLCPVQPPRRVPRGVGVGVVRGRGLLPPGGDSGCVPRLPPQCSPRSQTTSS